MRVVVTSFLWAAPLTAGTDGREGRMFPKGGKSLSVRAITGDAPLSDRRLGESLALGAYAGPRGVSLAVER